MIDLLRGITRSHEAVTKRGEWRREDYRGSSLYGKTLGLIGMGRLGKIMAKGGAGFRMKVIFHDPQVEQSAFPEFKKVSLDELLKESDVVAVHVHLTDETTNMISERELSLMRKSAILINTARGKIIHEAAVIKALEDGVIAGYGADVLAGENDFGDDASLDPLVKYASTHSNVIITPHIGGMTSDSRVATDVFIAEKVSKYLKDL
jgi:D-3-phosphoglycerate dehydrogenase